MRLKLKYKGFKYWVQSNLMNKLSMACTADSMRKLISTSILKQNLKIFLHNLKFHKNVDDNGDGRMNDDICQIKLVMDVFEIAGPNKKGN